MVEAGVGVPAMMDKEVLEQHGARLGRYYIIEASHGPEPVRCVGAWLEAEAASFKTEEPQGGSAEEQESSDVEMTDASTEGDFLSPA